MIGRRSTRLTVLATVVLVVAACSGDDEAPAGDQASAGQDATGADATAAGDDTAADDAGGTGGAVGDDGDDADTGPAEAGPADEPTTVTMSVRTGTFDAELTAPLDSDDADPFGLFGSCSGLRASVGTYSVLVSDPDAPVRSVSVITDDAVDGPGVYDAEVRVEPAAGTALAGAGTITLDPGLATGSFVAFSAGDGSSMEGDFECAGAVGEPAMLRVGADDGELDTVEVFALLRRADEERVVGLTATADGTASIRCPGAGGPDDGDDVLVAVDGDSSVGAITSFELTSPPSPTLRMRVGSGEDEFDAVVVEADRSATSGTFQATGPDGLTVDGAFRCT